MIKEIQRKFARVDDKSGFINRISKKIGLRPGSVKNNHLAGIWDIPEKYQKTYITELDKWLEKVRS